MSADEDVGVDVSVESIKDGHLSSERRKTTEANDVGANGAALRHVSDSVDVRPRGRRASLSASRQRNQRVIATREETRRRPRRIDERRANKTDRRELSRESLRLGYSAIRIRADSTWTRAWSAGERCLSQPHERRG